MSRQTFSAEGVGIRGFETESEPEKRDLDHEGHRGQHPERGRLLAWPGSRYEGVVQRAVETAQQQFAQLVRGVSSTSPLTELLAEGDLARLRVVVSNDPRYHCLPVCERLLEHAQTLADESTELALGHAMVAVELAERLTRTRERGASLPWDLLGRAWTMVGSLRGSRGDVQDAEDAFQRAERCLAAGSGDPGEEAELLRSWAQLRGQVGQWAEAEVLLERGSQIAAEAGSMGALLVDQALLRARRGDLAGARRLCWHGLLQAREARDRKPLLEMWRRLSASPQDPECPPSARA